MCYKKMKGAIINKEHIRIKDIFIGFIFTCSASVYALLAASQVDFSRDQPRQQTFAMRNLKKKT